MKATNNTGTVNVYYFTASKFNKQSTIYTGNTQNPNASFITSAVKIERFQGFSKAYNLGLYFRIRNHTNWAKCEQVTGLWKTSVNGFYYGDRKTDGTKTLLIFKLDETNDNLTVIEYPNGYYPSKAVIEKLIQNL